MRDGSEVCTRGEREKEKRSSAVENDDSVFCAERESALAVMVEVLVGERDSTEVMMVGLGEEEKGGRTIAVWCRRQNG